MLTVPLNGEGSGGRSARGPSHWVTGTICGGEANKGTDPGDFSSSINPVQRYETDPTLVILTPFGVVAMKVFPGANDVLRLLSQRLREYLEPMPHGFRGKPDAERSLLFRSAKALSIRFHILMKQLIANRNSDSVPNSGAVWSQIEADFQFAYDNLPETQGQAGRVNKWAAAAYMGKAKLFQR